MIFFHEKYQHGAVIAGIALICMIEIMIPLHRAYAIPVDVIADDVDAPAFFGTWATNIADVAANTEDTAVNTLDEVQTFAATYILKPAMRILIFAAVKSITDQTVAWITGDSGKSVGFVQDLEKNLQDEADLRAGDYLNHLVGINFCSLNLQNLVKLQIEAANRTDFRRLNSQLSCKLTGIVDNVENFYKDFNNGSWKAFMATTMTPENNYYGASLIALENLETAKGSIAEKVKQQMQAGKGFLGVQVTKKAEKCEWIPEKIGLEDIQVPAHFYCYNEDVATTPGGLVADALTGSMVNDGPDAILSSDEVAGIIDTALTTIVNTVVQQLVSGRLFGA